MKQSINRFCLFSQMLLLCCVCCCLTLQAQAQSSNTQITQSVVAGGGGTSSNGSLQLDGTIGQSITGASSGGVFTLFSGFWSGAAAPTTSALLLADANGVYGGTVSFSATLTANGASVSGKLITFALNGTTVGTATTDTNGLATLNNVSLSGINAGIYPGAISAQFAGDATLAAITATSQLTIQKATPVLQVTGGTFTYDGQPHPATVSVIGVNNEALSPVSVLYNGSSAVPVNAGSYAITASFAGNVNYNGVVNNQQSIIINQASQAITFGALSNKTYSDAPFTIAATASSGLSVSFASQTPVFCSVSGNTVTILATGTCAIRASQAGNNNYNDAANVDQSFTVSKADQTITVNTHAPSSAAYNTSFTVAATSPSGLPITYSSSGSCTNTGATFTMTSGTGTCMVKYDQAGDGNYNAATQVVETVTAQKASQTITFAALASKTFGDPDFTVSATASSGLSVSFAASGQCSVSSNTVHFTGAGSCIITASQAGDGNYNAATPVGQTFVINKATATITLSNLTQTYDGTAKSPTTTTTPSGLSATFTYTLNGSPVTSPTNVGNYNVTATINDANYQGSTTGVLVINKATPVITWNNPANIVYGTPLSSTQLNATANLAGSFVYTPAAGTVLHAGNNQTLHVVFTPTDTANYNTASKDVTINVTKATLTVKADNKTRVYGAGNPPLTYTITGFVGSDTQASATTGQPSLSTTALTNSNVGSYPITVAVGTLSAADYDFTFVNGTLSVTKADQTITFDALTNKTIGDAPFTVTATASSGLPVTFSIVSGPANINGNTITITGIGHVIVRASQAGDTNYNAAPSVDRAFDVTTGSASIALSNLTQTYDGTAKSPTATTTPSGLSVTFTYTQNGQAVTSPTNVGNYNVTATINDPSYQGTTTGILVITKATPVITWNNPANIVYGTPLSSTQLNATANVGGTFQYNPPAGTVLNVGTQQLLVTFTPTDTANYATASKSVQITVDPVTAAAFNLDSAAYTVNEGDGHVTITVNRTGGGTGAASVNYTTSDTAALANCNVFNGIASSRCDYAITVGTLRFADGELSKVIYIPLVDDSYAEGNESLSITLSDAVGENLGTVSTATITIQDNETVTGANPINGTDFFIREHYIDFLGREPEPGGYAGWQNILNNCGTTVAQPCDRIEVSSAFFRSEEFQMRGYFIYRFYSALGRIPHYGEFMPDFAKVSGFLSAEELEANKAAFVNEFMARQEFQTRYGSPADSTAYVNALLQTVGLPNHLSRGIWITGLANGTMTRAQVLRALVESGELYQKFYNEAFVVMQYIGYLRRDPDIMYLQWIQTLNQNQGNYRMMINGFLNSMEYRRRFGP